MTELSTKFNFQNVEEKWCRYWEANQVFHAKPNKKKKPYSVVIPPPNVTGILHMGHALNNTLQDIIVRYKRMSGFETCWMPGTDHAGIATQNVVEKEIAQNGKTRYDIGRDKMLEMLWDWKQQYGDTIINQLKKLGASCDWSRTRFTMDEHYSNVVLNVFVSLYNKELIYRGKYIINWCPRCKTALSDEEAEHREQQGALYHIRYPLKDSDHYLVVATTRPETMLGDTAVAVNPEDRRYKDLIGKTVVLPILNREIKIIEDKFVDPEFGTGAVKVTPAHDPNDFDMGNRHKLEFINIMNEDASLNKEAGEFSGMDRFEAREAVVDTLKELKLLEKVEEHTHAVGHCYRCHTVVEPYLSRQWFVSMKPLAKPAARVVKDGNIQFYPDRWKKVYLNWMKDIRDWCISRQIWWGHRIPVWYCDQCPEEENMIVTVTPPAQCPRCQSSNLKQDEDVLDTWFSSWLWPFATFGWPDKTEDTDYFYPTSSLFTASEIIFFWVARMVMAGLEFMDDIPFSDVYIHGTVRDSKGRKMSKSLGNAIDPLDIIKDYGADALRFSLIINSGQDLYISKEKFEVGRNFANKIWNASRLVLMNAKLKERNINPAKDIDTGRLDLPNRWILSKFYSTLSRVEKAINSYRFSEAENLIFEFFWRNYCDWYLEMIKGRFSEKDTQGVAFAVLEKSIRMMHPFIPFVTEEIWSHLGISKDCLSTEAWPALEKSLIKKPVEEDMAVIFEIITSIRNIKTQWNIKPQQELDCIFTAKEKAGAKLVESNSAILKELAKIGALRIVKDFKETKNAASGLVSGIQFYVPLGELIDVEKEKKRILRQIEQQKKSHDSLQNRLKNKGFLSKAPEEVIQKEKDRLSALAAQIQDLQQVIKGLN